MKRLTKDEAVKIREQRALGLKYKALAEMFGVTVDTIGSVCRGRTFKDEPQVLAAE